MILLKVKKITWKFLILQFISRLKVRENIFFLKEMVAKS